MYHIFIYLLIRQLCEKLRSTPVTTPKATFPTRKTKATAERKKGVLDQQI